jgi:hypothetical protein
VKALQESTGLPKLPNIEFGLYEGPELSNAASQLKKQVIKVSTGRQRQRGY